MVDERGLARDGPGTCAGRHRHRRAAARRTAFAHFVPPSRGSPSSLQALDGSSFCTSPRALGVSASPVHFLIQPAFIHCVLCAQPIISQAHIDHRYRSSRSPPPSPPRDQKTRLTACSNRDPWERTTSWRRLLLRPLDRPTCLQQTFPTPAIPV